MSKTTTTTKSETHVNIFSTSYHYYRNWVKDILVKGKVSAKFIRDEVGYNGFISVSKEDVSKAKKVLSDYVTKYPDSEMWW